MSREHQQLRIRVPPELKDALDKAAETNNRTLTSEVVYRLEQSIEYEAERELLKNKEQLINLIQMYDAHLNFYQSNNITRDLDAHTLSVINAEIERLINMKLQRTDELIELCKKQNIE